jgi:hypothetical protein
MYHSSSFHDDATAYSDIASTIISYEPSKKLAAMEDDGIERKTSGYSGPTDDPNKLLREDGASSEPRLVKVPGGEYYENRGCI